MGRLGFKVGVSASYGYLRLSFMENKVIHEKFSRKIALNIFYVKIHVK